MPSAPSRRAQPRIDRRQLILEHAEALFAERGYEETKVSDICASAGVAYGTFFNHFGEKRDLLRALSERSLATVSHSLEELAKQPAPLEEQLRLLFRGGEQGFDASRRELVGHIWTIAATDAAAAREQQFHAAFAAFLREGVSRGEVRDDLPVAVLAEAVGSIFSCMALNWVHIDEYPVEERARHFARFLADAMAPRAASHAPARPRGRSPGDDR